ncbi:MAG: ABC transporter ATP-binding protein [Thermodesulfobacteriota bacterium]
MPVDQIVVLEKVTKRFDEVVAVDQVSLAIARGEFVTLLGPSGSGKTTTLMMIAGFEMPTSGLIYLDGEMVVHKPAYRRNTGMAFQSYALFPHMTIFENIAFPLRMRRRSKDEINREVKRALDLVKLADYGARYPRQLSGGQQQRIALARALVYNPPVLLMDEPLGALDKKLREHMQLEIKQLHESLGITVIYVTHDQSEALTMSDRIALMNEGRIEQIGAPADLYDRPANRFVADFIGDTNLMDDLKVIGAADGRLELASKSGLRFWARSAGRSVPATPSLAIRPERIRLLNSASERQQAFDGRIKDIVYLGSSIKYIISLNDEATITVTVGIDRVNKDLQVGAEVLLGWNDDDVNLL